MTRNLILLFGLVITTMLGLALYHLSAVNQMAGQAISLFHWEDTRNSATIRDVMRIRSFKPVKKRRINLGYTESVHWFRFQLVAGSLPNELSFEIRDHTIDRLELFAVTNGIVTSLGETGSRLPFAQRPSPTKTFVYLLNVEAHQQVAYYLRLDKRHENLATELTRRQRTA
jgi:two-component system, sensor histidine kinase LadS